MVCVCVRANLCVSVWLSESVRACVIVCAARRHGLRKMTSTGTVRYLTHADSAVDPLASFRSKKLPT